MDKASILIKTHQEINGFERRGRSGAVWDGKGFDFD